MEGKKISFGFMKTKKVEKPVIEEKRDYIECVEEKSIKIVGGEEVEEAQPLVIPMKPNTLITAERLKEIAERVESGLDEIGPEKTIENKNKPEDTPSENLTLDQMAVRELLQEANKEVKMDTQEFTVPIPSKPVIDGEKESTLEDYESVPVQDFGLAMLRGMGWAPGKEQAKYKQPELRPKGLGLGADKVISKKQKANAGKDSKEEELAIVKNSYVKITTGKHSGYYGKVVSLDEDNGRVMVDIVVKKETVSLSEFMMQPVTKAEFDKEAKVINTEAYEAYKKKETSQNKKSSRNESPSVGERSRNASPKTDRGASSSQNSRDVSKEYRKDTKEENRRKDETSSNGKSKESSRRERSRRNSSSSEERSKKKDKYKRDSSSSEDRQVQKKDRYKRDASEDREKRKKDKYRRDSRNSEDRSDKRSKDRRQRNSSSEGDRRKTADRKKKEKDKKRYSSNDSLSSLSESEKKKKHKSSRRRHDSSESEPDTHKKEKRDIDKKRKGKKKKRDRDRSPNYKKHRK